MSRRKKRRNRFVNGDIKNKINKRKLPMSVVGLFAWAWSNGGKYHGYLPDGASIYAEKFIFRTSQIAAEFVELASLARLMDAKQDIENPNVVWMTVDLEKAKD